MTRQQLMEIVKMKGSRVTASVVITVVLFIASLALNIASPVDWERAVKFGDSADYLRQSRLSIFSLEFYAPHPSPGFYPRPFMVPLLYKIAGSDPHHVVLLQKVIHSVATLFLASTLGMLVTSQAAKCLLIITVYGLMSWWTVVGWAAVVLSESLSFSFWWCWISSALSSFLRRTTLSFYLHLVSVCVLALTRDTWPYVFVFCYTSLVVSSLILWRRASRRNIILLVVALMLFFFQQQTAAIGERTRLPLLNIIAVRILPQKSYLRWMAKAGMPQVKELEKRFKNRPSLDDKTRELYALYTEAGYLPLFQWLKRTGKTTYMRFLLTHPRQLSLRQETRLDLKRMLAYDFFDYVGPAQGYSRAVVDIFPMFRAGAVALLVVLTLLAHRCQNRPALLVPLVGMILCAFQAFLCYQADALEVERHLVVTRVTLELIGLTSIALLFDLAVITASPGCHASVTS